MYDKDGAILRPAERYKNVAVPRNVSEAIAKKYPKWSVSKDVYLVTYREQGNATKKVYKFLLENGDMRMRVKINDQGEFL